MLAAATLGIEHAPGCGMAVLNQAVRYGQRRLGRRLARSVPWIGGIIAIATIGAAMRRKGVVGGTLDTALNAIPFVGGMKNAAEVVRGRDFIRDRQPVQP
jgi:hypothetical protein